MPLLAGKVAEVVAFLFSFILHAVVLTTMPDPMKGKPGNPDQSQTQSEKGQDQTGTQNKKEVRSARAILMELSALMIEHRYAEKSKDKVAEEKFETRILSLSAELGLRDPYSDPKKRLRWLRAWFPLIVENLALAESGNSVNPESVGKELNTLAKYIDDLRLQWREQEIQLAKTQTSRASRQGKLRNQASVEPEWLREINHVRAGLHSYALGNYEASQSRLTTALMNRRTNYGSGALLTMALFYLLLEDQNKNAASEPKSVKTRPPSQLALRIYGNHIEPVLILPKSKSILIPQILNLYSGEVEPLKEPLEFFYDISILPWAYMEFHQRAQPRGERDLALYRIGNKVSRGSQIKENQTQIRTAYLGYELKFPSLLEINQKLNFYNPGLRGFQKLELLIPLPIVKSSVNPSAEKPNDVQENPNLEKLNQDMSASLQQALNEVMGIDEKALKPEEKSEALNSLLEMAKDLTSSQSSSDLHDKLNRADADLIEKLKNDPKSLTPEEIEQLKAMIAGFQLLKERRLPNEDTPYFLADPVVRVATPFENANEFTTAERIRLPFLLKLPPEDQLTLRIGKSKENKKIKRGFDYRILHPLRDIVFSTQNEVDEFLKLEFSEKKDKLYTVLTSSENRSLPETNLRSLQKFIAGFHKSLGSKRFKEKPESPNLARAMGWRRALLTAWKYRQLELILSEEVWYSQWQSKPTPTSVALVTEITFETLQKVIEDPTKFLRNLDLHPDRDSYMLIQSGLGAWAQGINAYLKAEDPLTTRTWSSLLTYWNGKKTTSGNTQTRAYLPDSANEGDFSDLTYPFLPLLTYLLDPKAMEVYLEETDSIQCEQKVFWVDLPKLDMEPIAKEQGFHSVREWGEKQGQRCIVSYFEIVPGTVSEMRLKEKLIVTQVGTYIIEKVPYSKSRLGTRKVKFENLKLERMQISAQVFWRLLLMMPQDQLQHPSVQSLLWKRVKPQMYAVLENEVLDETSAESFLYLSTLPVWIWADEFQNTNTSLNIAAEWKRKSGESLVSVEVELSSDPIQQANLAHLPRTGSALPRAIAELKLKSYRLLFDKNLKSGKIRQTERIAPEPIKDIVENLGPEGKNITYTGPTYLRSSKYFTSPVNALLPKESWQGERRRVSLFKVLETLRFQLSCEYEVGVRSIADNQVPSLQFGVEKRLVSERDCSQESLNKLEAPRPSEPGVPARPIGSRERPPEPQSNEIDLLEGVPLVSPPSNSPPTSKNGEGAFDDGGPQIEQ